MEIEELFKNLNFSNVIWEILTPVIFSCADFVTGYIQAIINKNVKSSKMRVGLLHKVLIFLIIILSFVFSFAFNIPYVSNVICIYVVIMETTSIIENLKKAGIDTGKFGNILNKEGDENDKRNWHFMFSRKRKLWKT